MKNYIGISRDHSGSMRHLAHVAVKDYNSKIDAIRSAAVSEDQDTIVSVVECGHGRTATVGRVVVNSSVANLKPIQTYVCDGPGTPLWDSVGDLIEQFQSVPDYSDPNVSFLVMAITDGEENYSKKWTASSLANKIRELQATDRWTFVFRVPRGYGNKLVRLLGISHGNIQEWDQTEKGVAAAAQVDTEAFTQYFSGRTIGASSTMRFYADLSNVSSAEVAAKMEDISAEISIYPVSPADDGSVIKPFLESRTGKTMVTGTGFYQLSKSERAVQDYKVILIRDKTTQAVYFGAAARQMLDLPTWGDVKLSPGSHGNFDIFIQSTSLNRKLIAGTSLIYWANPR